MTAKIIYTTRPEELLGYEIGVVRKESPKIRILDWHGIVINPADAFRLNENWTDEQSLEDFREIGRALAKDVFRQYDYYASDNRQAQKKFIHLVLSFSSADIPKFETDPDIMREIALIYLDKMGYQDNQWLMTEHLDTESPHIHIMINRIGKDRKALPKAYDHVRSEKARHMLNERYGLAEPGEAPIRNESHAERDRIRKEIKSIITEVIAEGKYSSIFHLNQRITERGISMKWHTHIEKGKELKGVSFAMGNVAIPGYKIGFPGQRLMKIIKDQQERQQKERESSPSAIIVRNMTPRMVDMSRDIRLAREVYDDLRDAGMTFEAETEMTLHNLEELWQQALALFESIKKSLSLELMEEMLRSIQKAIIAFYKTIKQIVTELFDKISSKYLSISNSILKSFQESIASLEKNGINPTAMTSSDPLTMELAQVKEEAITSLRDGCSQLEHLEDIRDTVVRAFRTKDTKDEISSILRQKGLRVHIEPSRNTFIVKTENKTIMAESIMNKTEITEILQISQRIGRPPMESKSTPPVRGMRRHL